MVVVKRAVSILISVLMALNTFLPIAFAADGDDAAEPISAVCSGTWFETAFATWTGASVGGYRAYVRTLGAYDWRDDSPITGWLENWEEVDEELVRKVDPVRNTWRVDVPGLPKGEYDIQVRAADGATVLYTFDSLKTWSFPRNGAAFVPSNQNTFEGNHNFAPNGAVGGYLPDGRVNPASKIVYVTPKNQSIFANSLFSDSSRGSTANAKQPLVVRILGTLTNRSASIGSGNGNVTVEGIGPDAGIYSGGTLITTGGAHNVVIRNLHLDYQQGDMIELNGSSTSIRGSNYWVHNNTFGYGQNLYLAGTQSDPDQAKGDGALDITNHARNYTISYNHFAGSSKAMLIGGGVGSISAHYGTIDHNWFQRSEERTPRVRNGRIHVFNNLYEDVQGHPYHNELFNQHTGYGVGAGHNATIWAEGNIFDNVNFPFLRSRQGHARGFEPIDYTYDASRLAFPDVPGAENIYENANNNSGKNHFFGDAPGFIVAREAVTGAKVYGIQNSAAGIHGTPKPIGGGEAVSGDFPADVAGFRQASDYMTGLDQASLDALRAAASALQPNVIIDKGNTHFDPSLDVGVKVAAGSTTSNPNMSTSPAAQLDWSFRPTHVSADAVWKTETQGQIEALRAEIETYAGAMPALEATEVPAAPAISSVTINDESRRTVGAGNGLVPNPNRVLVYENTFTINWINNDVLTESYEIQWDQGKGAWETITTVEANARPTSYITQYIDQFATPQTARVLAKADSRAASYAFRIRAINSRGASDWSNSYASLTYAIEPISNQTLNTLSEGYAAGTQETKTIAIHKTGTGDLANLKTAISGTNAASFTITQPANPTLDINTPSTSFTVQAKDGLAAGTYTATVTISADTMSPVSFTITQSINGSTLSTVATPSFSVPGGTYNTRLAVTLKCATAAAAIYYTTDGSEPTETSNKYDGAPIAIQTSTTLRAKAFKTGLIASEPASVSYTIGGASHRIEPGTSPHSNLKTAYGYRNDATVYYDSALLRLGKGDSGRISDLWIRFPELIGSGSDQIPTTAKIVSAKLILTLKENSGNRHGPRGIKLYRISDADALGEPWFGTTGIKNGLDFNYRDHRLGRNIPWKNGAADILSALSETDREDAYEYLPLIYQAQGYDRIELDVTASVQAWLTGTANQGWFLTIDPTLPWTAGDEITLYGVAAENAGQRPALEIVYLNTETDNVPPAAITGLSASVGDQQVILNWTNPTADFNGARIIRKEGAVPFDPWDGAIVYEGTASTYLDQNLTNDALYYYAAFSYDALRNYAKRSWVKAVPAQGTGLPGAPSGFNVTLSGTRLQFSWTNSPNNVAWFVIEASKASTGTWTEILSPAAATTSCTAALNAIPMDWEPMASYEFRIKAVNYSGVSDYAVAGSQVAIPNLPLAPADLTWSIISAGRVNLSWTDRASNETGYRVDLCAADGTVLRTVELGIGAGNCSVTGLTPGTEYIIKVAAVNTLGEAAATTQSIITTVDPKGGLL
jgi:pectate lyase